GNPRLLHFFPTRRSSDLTRVTRNVGSTRNRGIELTIETQNIENNNFSWTTNLNISRNENQLVELYEGIPQTRDRTIWMEGEDLKDRKSTRLNSSHVKNSY